MPGMGGMPGMGAMPGMGGMPMQPPSEEEFAAQMKGFEEMFKSMGMQMDD